MVKEGLMYFPGVALILLALIYFWFIPYLEDAFDKEYNPIKSLIVAIIIAMVLSVGVIAFAFAI